MAWVESVQGTQSGVNEDDKSAVREQLERLLGSPYFSHSRRFPSFFRYVVEKTLAGQEDVLKERTLGVEIFARQPDYDTASDPIVRVTAAEIRKRIAQYYQEPGHENELRILLPSGSYIPQFQSPTPVKDDSASVGMLAVMPATAGEASASATLPHRYFWKGFGASFVLLALLAGAAIWAWQAERRSPVDFFWGPVWKSSDPVLFCIADQKQYSTIALGDATDQSHATILPDSLTAVVIDDLSPMVNVAGLLKSNGKKYTLTGESATNLTDLRSGPAILIGAFDNAWTLRLTKQLRYHFVNDAEMTQLGIVDSNAPGIRWIVDRKQQMATNNYRDYAIIARFTDSSTGKVEVVVAGVARSGAIAAGEFLTNPAYLTQLVHAAKAAGNKPNMEVVLSTQIIGGEPGAPKIEASYFW